MCGLGNLLRLGSYLIKKCFWCYKEGMVLCVILIVICRFFWCNKAVECPDKQEMPVCRFFLVGNCKFEKSEDKKCPYSQPKVCKAYDKRGPSGCHEKECPQGLHRKICDKLINGNCRRKPEKCGFYHPTHLRRVNSQAKKKKKEEESSDKSEWLETIMDGIKKFSLSPQIMQFPMSPVITVLAIPPPPTSKRGKKG